MQPHPLTFSQITTNHPAPSLPGFHLQILEAEALIPVDTSTGEPRTDARTLHASLGSKQEFTNWFKKRVEECDLVKAQDYGVNHKFVKNPEGGRPTIDYWLTLDAAKEMAMLERNEAGKAIRRYLIEVEKRSQARQPARTHALLQSGNKRKFTDWSDQRTTECGLIENQDSAFFAPQIC